MSIIKQNVDRHFLLCNTIVNSLKNVFLEKINTRNYMTDNNKNNDNDKRHQRTQTQRLNRQTTKWAIHWTSSRLKGQKIPTDRQKMVIERDKMDVDNHSRSVPTCKVERETYLETKAAMFRLYGEEKKTTFHKSAKKTEYEKKHDRVAKIVRWNLTRQHWLKKNS